MNSEINNVNANIISSKKYNLILCELHHIGRHGKTSNSDPNIDGHYIVYDKFEPFTGLSYSHLQEYEEYDTDSEYDSDRDEYENSLITLNNEIIFIKRNLLESGISFGPHPIIRNYHNIVSRADYIKPEIAQCITLPTLETIAILKTFWIRIIQKKWKKIYKERQDMIKKFGNPTNLKMRELGTNNFFK